MKMTEGFVRFDSCVDAETVFIRAAAAARGPVTARDGDQ
jgi:hypothetical protein